MRFFFLAVFSLVACGPPMVLRSPLYLAAKTQTPPGERRAVLDRAVLYFQYAGMPIGFTDAELGVLSSHSIAITVPCRALERMCECSAATQFTLASNGDAMLMRNCTVIGRHYAPRELVTKAEVARMQGELARALGAITGNAQPPTAGGTN